MGIVKVTIKCKSVDQAEKIHVFLRVIQGSQITFANCIPSNPYVEAIIHDWGTLKMHAIMLLCAYAETGDYITEHVAEEPDTHGPACACDPCMERDNRLWTNWFEEENSRFAEEPDGTDAALDRMKSRGDI